MKLLFLFFTQSEGGAPGYLSRKGEEAAKGLSESLGQFALQSLGIDVESGAETRAKSLGEDIRWKAFRSPEVAPEACAASFRLFPEVLLIAGAKERTMNTAQAVAKRLALPVIVDARADSIPGEKGSPGSLADALGSLTSPQGTQGGWISDSSAPKVVVLGTSVDALGCWLEGVMPAEQRVSLMEMLGKTTSGGTLPTVFACGFERGDQGEAAWLFD